MSDTQKLAGKVAIIIGLNVDGVAIVTGAASGIGFTVDDGAILNF